MASIFKPAMIGGKPYQAHIAHYKSSPIPNNVMIYFSRLVGSTYAWVVPKDTFHNLTFYQFVRECEKLYGMLEGSLDIVEHGVKTFGYTTYVMLDITPVNVPLPSLNHYIGDYQPHKLVLSDGNGYRYTISFRYCY
jgi:hypothetical protein